MKESKKNSQSYKRVTSITGKLHRRFARKKLRMFIGFDLLLIILLAAAFLATVEYTVNREMVHMYGFQAEFSADNTQWSKAAYYCVVDDEGKLVHPFKLDKEIRQKYTIRHLNLALLDKNNAEYIYINLYWPIVVILITAGGFFILQLISLIFSAHGDRRKIKKLLSPINEMALKAEELSKLTMSEERYHEIENALDTINPGEVDALSLGNDDLKGIEAAMNNLIIRMRDTYRQQARFVNDASHELRTPITVIHGYVNMLDRWGKTDEKILAESIDAIKNETDHMQHLVEQLLFLARGDSGKTALKMESFTANDMVKEVYEESLMIDENHIYRYKDAEEELKIEADYGLIKQALRILIDNAAKYTKAGDEIVISLGKVESHPYIQVQDTGIGMSEKDVANMFERFYRADDARNYQGTGLGLSIAKWIVDKHQGRFEVLSRSELGTRIRIIL